MGKCSLAAHVSEKTLRGLDTRLLLDWPVYHPALLCQEAWGIPNLHGKLGCNRVDTAHPFIGG